MYITAERNAFITRPPFFPMMIDLLEKNILIVGGGHIASRRALTLLTCGATLTAISPNFCPAFPQSQNITRISRPFRPEDLTPNFALVIAATNSRPVNSLVHSLANTLNIPVNVCDSQDECDFFFPSLINHENVAVCVCSAGISARLTKRLSDKLRRIWASWVNDENFSVL
ncbi:MAG: bifunctional precorrin-2 dehydrogenase/sirohydrochlorin ferrochelatase [Synergistaceae bacterium]|nr:bifunctional precorrin-2 dehydrogenase/sirohydrochlorin ferrochelatase [Synergistaceae bacterium]